MNWHKEHIHHDHKEVSCKSKKVHFISDKTKSHESLSDGSKDLHLIIDENIAAALSHQEKSNIHKFEVLFISSGNNDGENSARS
eukprot:512330-Ditylum_brightwellii.AAC.1